MNSWFKDNYIGIYSSHNEGKSVVAERFTIYLWILGLKIIT